LELAKTLGLAGREEAKVSVLVKKRERKKKEFVVEFGGLF
jgi:hypothetical protein